MYYFLLPFVLDMANSEVPSSDSENLLGTGQSPNISAEQFNLLLESIGKINSRFERIEKDMYDSEPEASEDGIESYRDGMDI